MALEKKKNALSIDKKQSKNYKSRNSLSEISRPQ